MRQVLLLVGVFLVGWLGARVGDPPAASAAGGPADFTQAIQRANPSVVRILVRSSTSSVQRSRDDGVGAGFVVDPSGLIVTSRHVVAGAQRIVVTLSDGRALDARLESQDEATDTALLRVAVTGMRPLPTGDPRDLRVGQWVVAGGSPYSMANSWSVGIVSGLGRENVGVGPRSLRDFIQTDAAANLGNSGGPLLDADGRVVGLMTAILSRTGGHQGVAFAIPVDAVMQAVGRMRGHPGGAPVARPTLGVRVHAVRALADRPGGLEISGFDPDSSAQASGLRAGDVLLVAEGVVLRRPADLQRIVWAHAPGDVLRLTVQRGRQRLEVRVVVR